jgi:hypothetical protein
MELAERFFNERIAKCENREVITLEPFTCTDDPHLTSTRKGIYFQYSSFYILIVAYQDRTEDADEIDVSYDYVLYFMDKPIVFSPAVVANPTTHGFTRLDDCKFASVKILDFLRYNN